MPEELITIPRAEYDELKHDSNFLNCLRGAGVDNWEGYDYAIEEFNQQYPGEW